MTTQMDELRRSLRFACVLLFELRLAGVVPADKRSTVDAFLSNHISKGTTAEPPANTPDGT